jgi:hypothetical protein
VEAEVSVAVDRWKLVDARKDACVIVECRAAICYDAT